MVLKNHPPCHSRARSNLPLLGPLLRAWESMEDEYAYPHVIAARVARSRDGSAPPLVGFPEGACTVGGCMVPFNELSVFHAKAPAVIVPTVVSYNTANSFNLSWTPRYPLARPRGRHKHHQYGPVPAEPPPPGGMSPDICLEAVARTGGF